MTPTTLQARARSAFPAGQSWDGLKASRRCRFRPANMLFPTRRSRRAVFAELSAPVPLCCSWKRQTYFTPPSGKIEAPEKGLEYSERGIYLLLKRTQQHFQHASGAGAVHCMDGV